MSTETTSEMHGHNPLRASTGDPKKEVEKILAAAMSPNPLPIIADLALYYVAGVSANQTTGVESVVYTPEFLYVADLGTKRLAGVSIPFNISKLGDPSFPDYSTVAIRSIKSRDPKDLILPDVAGQLLVGVTPGTLETDAIKEVSKVAKKVSKLATDLYQAEVLPFDEDGAAMALKAISFVRYAELDHVVRMIDFKPGWRVKRVL